MRQISTVVAPIHVQMVAPVRTFQMISGAAVLQGSQAVIVQFKFLNLNLLIVTPTHAITEEHAVYVAYYSHTMYTTSLKYAYKLP